MQCRYPMANNSDKEIVNLTIPNLGRVTACEQIGIHLYLDEDAALSIDELKPYIEDITSEWSNAQYYFKETHVDIYKIGGNYPTGEGAERFHAAYALCKRFETFYKALEAVPAVMIKKQTIA